MQLLINVGEVYAVKRVVSLLICGVLIFGMVSMAFSKVSLKYWIWDKNQLPAIKMQIAEFEKLHPDIKVNVQVIPWGQYWTKLQTAVAGGVAPDIFWMNAYNAYDFMARNVLLNLTEYVKKDGIDMSLYPDAVVNYYTYEGKIFALPKDVDSIALFYNKDMFDEANEPYPDENWTWDYLANVAAKLTVWKGNKPVKFGIGTPSRHSLAWEQGGLFPIIYSFGGNIVSPDKKKVLFDDPKVIEAVKFARSLMLDRRVSPKPGEFPGDPFAGEKVAACTAGSWTAKKYLLQMKGMKVGVAPLPLFDGKRITVSHGLGHVIFAKTKHPKEAWEFIKFASGPKGQEILGKTGAVIPAYKPMMILWVESFPEEIREEVKKAFIDPIEHAKPLPSGPGVNKWRSDAIKKYIRSCFRGEIGAEEACQKINEEANRILKEVLKQIEEETR